MGFVTRFVGTNLDFLMGSFTSHAHLVLSWSSRGWPNSGCGLLVSSDLELCRPTVWLISFVSKFDAVVPTS